MNADFQILPADFSSTTFEVLCVSQQAKAAFCGAFSINVPKSWLPAFSVDMQQRGLTVA